MKTFEELLKDLEEGEEIEDKEIEARIEVFIRTVKGMEKRQKKLMSKLSRKLSDLFKLGCNSKQLMRAFKLESKRVMSQ